MSTSLNEHLQNIRLAADRRLQPLALQSLSIKDIMLHHRKSTTTLPHRQNLSPVHLKIHEELQQYLTTEEPTGREKNEASKRAASRYMAIEMMMSVYHEAKNVTTQEMCLDQIASWYGQTLVKDLGNPNLKQVKHVHPEKRGTGYPETTSNCHYHRQHETMANPNPTTSTHHIEHYQQRDLRSSHVRRMQNLRPRPTSSPFTSEGEQQQPSSFFPPRAHSSQSTRIKAQRPSECAPGNFNFKSNSNGLGLLHYEPETMAEAKMNDMWLVNRQKEAQAFDNQCHVQSALSSWSKDKSREEGELLRRLETSRMIPSSGGSEQLLSESSSSIETQDNLLKKKSDDTAASTPELEQLPENPTVVLTPVVIKRQVGSSSSSASPLTGMRYKNTLPSNLLSIKKAESPDLPRSSKNHKPTSPAKRTITTRSRSKPTAKLRGLMPASLEPPQDPEMKLFHQAQNERRISLTRSTVVLADETPEKNPLKIHEELQSPPEGGSSSAILPRRIISTAPSRIKPASSSSSEMIESQLAHIPHRPIVTSTGITRTTPATTVIHCSAMRYSQLNELDAIRAAFERKKLSYNPQVFHRALLIPEDKPELQCVLNLPTPGSKLSVNPLLSYRNKLLGIKGPSVATKKKKGTKKKKAGSKKAGSKKTTKKKKSSKKK